MTERFVGSAPLSLKNVSLPAVRAWDLFWFWKYEAHWVREWQNGKILLGYLGENSIFSFLQPLTPFPSHFCIVLTFSYRFSSSKVLLDCFDYLLTLIDIFWINFQRFFHWSVNDFSFLNIRWLHRVHAKLMQHTDLER